MSSSELIDNNRIVLANALRKIAPDFEHLSIATGYWDLEGTMELIDQIENYKSIRLLIGQEPLSHRRQQVLNFDLRDSKNLFPDADFKHDLEQNIDSEELDSIRLVAVKLANLIEKKTLQVKVFRQPRLHAKAYIFGNFQSEEAVGIIGSSNFTKAGLTANAELNCLVADSRLVRWQPTSETDKIGHLSWFNNLWKDEEAEEWTGKFSEIIRESPKGNLCLGPYDVYIKTLMEVFHEEMVEVTPTTPQLKDVLYDFQEQGVLSLRKRLKMHRVAMLSDSVGLGKTISAGAIIKQYLEEGSTRIVILPPASLKSQWEDELESEKFSLIKDNDFKVISQQDLGRIEDLINYGRKTFAKGKQIDLVVIDEAHNLRNDGSIRHQKILELLQDNPKAHVLLLTATPVNNSLMDFVRQIELGAKGEMIDIKVPWKGSQGKKERVEYIEFSEAIRRIDSSYKKNMDKTPEEKQEFWKENKSIITAGVRRYLVRSTRKGAMKVTDGLKFPQSQVQQIEYAFSEEIKADIREQISQSVTKIFNNIDPQALDLEKAISITQFSAHPLEFFVNNNHFSKTIEDKKPKKPLTLSADEVNQYGVIPKIFQLVNFIGFVPYHSEIYRHKIYNKTVEEISAVTNDDESGRKIRTQLSVHNLLHVSWLKRLESSVSSLLKSVEYYKKRIELFEKYLNKGFIFSLKDANSIENDYGDDLERAFNDFEKYQQELADLLELEDVNSAKKLSQYGIERTDVDKQIYNIDQMKKDLEKDKQISNLLISILTKLSEVENNAKMQNFVDFLKEQTKGDDFGKKVLVFSFFADTIKYLEDNLPKYDVEFASKTAFVYGNSRNNEKQAKLFSPISKQYQLKDNEEELNYLFATDVLSEGQNLQDAGILINYDLHWNPVRMIQRNGRINRLGSKFDEVLIANIKPHEDLDLYLKLISRLEGKIDKIKNSIGTDQSILGEEINPIDWTDNVDIYSNNTEQASNALNNVINSNEEDFLSWTDDYLIELMQFKQVHTNENGETDDEFERIRDISLGKWNYLPSISQNRLNKLNEGETLALYNFYGTYENSDDIINNTAFAKVPKAKDLGPFSSMQVKIIEDEEALSLIKTTPKDNQKKLDKISVDRAKVQFVTKEEIRGYMTSDKQVYNLTSVPEEALNLMAEHFAGIDLLGLVQKNLRLSNDKREFQRLVNQICKQNKEKGSVYMSTISNFSKLVEKLQKQEKGQRIIGEVKGVLFYV